jgi:hypothetical protein
MLSGTQLLARARRYADDESEPYYISDEEMYTYLTEAEHLLAVAGRWLRTVREYDVTADDRWIEIGTSPEVIEFMEAELVNTSGTRYPLHFIGALDQVGYYTDHDDYENNAHRTRTLTPGLPRQLIFGKRTGYFELSPPADDDYVVEATQLVYPENAITALTTSPTIPERHHLALPIGAAMLAIEGAEAEQYSVDRVTNLQQAWQRALIRASDEGALVQHDASVVRFSNELW